MHQDLLEYYKQLEKEMNQHIHDLTNSRNFTCAFGRAMEIHLKRLRIHKRLTTRWLKRLNLPNKDEIAAISVRLVECEDRLDSFDEMIHCISKVQHKNLEHLKMVRKSSEDLLTVLKSEAKDIRVSKINALERDMNDLIKYFET